jgi:hypothetical protein
MTNPNLPLSNPGGEHYPGPDDPPPPTPIDPYPPINYPEYPAPYPPPPPMPPYNYPPPYQGNAMGYGGPMGYVGPPGYPNPYDPYQVSSPETNGLATGSLITSIAGVVLGIPLTLFCYLGLLIPITGIVLGAMALNQIKRTNQQGRGLAIAGIAVGATTVLFVIAIMILALSVSAAR